MIFSIDFVSFSQRSWGPTPTRGSLAHSRSAAAAGAADFTSGINARQPSTASHSEQRPLSEPGHLVQAAVLERQARVADDVADGAGDEGLAG